MNLKLKSHTSQTHKGYGAGLGAVETCVYECPCGNGEVEITRDQIPGFKEKSVVINCDNCRVKFKSVDFFTRTCETCEGHGTIKQPKNQNDYDRYFDKLFDGGQFNAVECEEKALKAIGYDIIPCPACSFK